MKPLVCDIAYPSTQTLTTDVLSGRIISFAYANANSELTATLQYCYQILFFSQICQQDADTLQSICIAEMQHLQYLGNAMIKLGVNPLYVQRPNGCVHYDTSTVSKSTTAQKMLLDSIAGELNAIAEYQKMLFVLKNEQVQAIIQRIVLDEQLHLQTLKQLLHKYAEK